MRLFFVLIMLLSLVQPAMAQSWFQRVFGSSIERTSFTEEERRLIRDFYFEQVRQGGTGEEYRDSRHDDRDNDRGKKNKEKKKDKKHGKDKGAPPGLAKKESLPPGLARQLEKNGTLPPGLAKRKLPDDLFGRLPKRTRKHERVVVDRDVVLLEKATGKVLDILRDVVVGHRR